MRIRAWMFGLLAVSAIAIVACGDDDSDGGGGGGGGGNKQTGCYGTPGQTCTGTAEYETCINGACNSDFVACYGAGYKTGSFSGPCADYVNCTMACACDANYSSCSQACVSKMTSDCQSCAMKLGTCVQGASCTKPVCTGGGTGGSAGNPGTGGGGGSAGSTGGTIETCADLAACCAKVSEPNAKSACDTIVGQAIEENCKAAGAGYAQLCP